MIYLAQPYSHEDVEIRQRRYEQGVAAATYCIEHLDLHVYAPIVHSKPIADLMQQLGRPRHEFDFWRRYDIDILRRCDGLRILELPGWSESVGVLEEMAVAKAIQLPITWLNPIDVEVWIQQEKARAGERGVGRPA